MQTIMTASGQPDIDEVIGDIKGYEVIDIVEYKNKLMDAIEKHVPDILVVGENLGGKEPLSSLLLKIKMTYPSIRIIYFCGELDYKDVVKNNTVGNLAYLGVYDIISVSNIAAEGIELIIKTPRTKESIEELIPRVRDSSLSLRKRKMVNVLFSEEKILGEDGQIIPNLHLFMSPKGGTGSSFVAFNTAIAIAKNGITKDGKKPRVCLVDFDLQGYGLGSFLNIRKKDMNLMDIAQDLKSIINEDGEINTDEENMHRVVDKIRKSVKTVEGVDIITGHDKNYEQSDMHKLRAPEISFILEILETEYEIIIADVKTDIEYTNLYPLLYLSRNIYAVLDMNYNTLCSNSSFKPYFESLGVDHKFKYVLNQYFDHKDLLLRASDIEKEGNIEFLSKIPKLTSIDFLNYLYKGDSVFSYNDDHYNFIQQSFLILADDLWRIQNAEILKKKMEVLDKKFNNKIDKEIEDRNKFFYERINFFDKISEIMLQKTEKRTEDDEKKKTLFFLKIFSKDKNTEDKKD